MISKITSNLLKRQNYLSKSTFSSTGVWDHIPLGPADPVLGITEKYNNDTHPNKINLGIGAYRDEQGKPVIMECVKRAEDIIRKTKTNNEYLPTQGDKDFIKHSLILAYGEEQYTKIQDRLAGIQVLSGTGALRLALEFCKRYKPDAKFYYPEPTWPNHLNVARDSGVDVQKYYWYDPETKLANFTRIFDGLCDAPDGQIILLHACAQNPTGCDLTYDQWNQLSEIFIKKKHLAFFDMAYQGFTSGDIHKDAQAVRLFTEKNIPLLTCQSYAKNMGLYGQRIGCLSFLFDEQVQAENAISQLKIIARPLWSSPPLHGAQIAKTILSTPELYDLWLKEVAQFAHRIQSMRTLLRDNLKSAGSQINWEHLVSQQGMFAYTGLHEQHCSKLTDDFHIYLMKSGRISVAGVNQNNVKYLAESIHSVTKDTGI
ncbi:Pyridoxal phosphate-dependent transferase [Pseudocohnilembus persalinus]|uniref:Aspartate aminotransferase n=1 Tax=Pseudocohnilembus persalinus TaxID=266149 RepID=A0A0V0QB53_PSEPJ|nr:Pyridoxal phosphate-dependent transferase [Pseudocohnilembus persalinus]|eukprot:KRW99469.1 Pyridoxal phosphate-dependent transferase [Pseudocohnilembus persalinus]